MHGGARWHPAGRLNPAFKGGKIADRDWVRKKYLKEKLSIRRLAKAANCSLRTAARWLDVHGIKTRSSKQGRLLIDINGSSNPNWRGASRCSCGKSKDRSSKKCAGCYSNQIRGASNPNWKGLAEISVLIRGWVRDYWRPKVFSRDGYKCCRCGDAKGGNLCAHHVERLECLIKDAVAELPLRTAKQRLRAVELVLKNRKIQSVSNGVTLCTSCHREIHRGVRKKRVTI